MRIPFDRAPRAHEWGGGINIVDGDIDVNIINCSFVKNDTADANNPGTGAGSGVYLQGDGSFVLTNCLFNGDTT